MNPVSYLNLQFVTQSLRNAYGPARRCLLGLFNVKTCTVLPLTRGKEGIAGRSFVCPQTRSRRQKPRGGAWRGAEPPPPTAPGIGFPGPGRAAEPGPAPRFSALLRASPRFPARPPPPNKNSWKISTKSAAEHPNR